MRHQLHLMKNIVLFGHNIHFKSDNTFDLIILQDYTTIAFVQTLFKNFEVYKYNAKLNMSYDKIVIEWCPYQQLIDV